MSIAPEFKEFISTTVIDTIFQLADSSLQFSMWVAASSSPQYDWERVINNLNDDGYDMETWIAAVASYREALAGRLEWISDVPYGN